LISFGLGTNVNNGNPGGVAGILWGQIQPTLSGHTLTGSSLYQAGYINFAGDQAASFPALMPDGSGNLTMVLDSMGHALNPSIFVAHRSAGARLGTFGAPSLLKLGLTATTDSRWGDFEATSYDGSAVWVASEYSGANTDWSTWIAQQ
jgi:hypothetical protein